MCYFVFLFPYSFSPDLHIFVSNRRFPFGFNFYAPISTVIFLFSISKFLRIDSYPGLLTFQLDSAFIAIQNFSILSVLFIILVSCFLPQVTLALLL